jgi:hypothetical protein
MSCNCVQEEEVDVRARMLQRLIKSSRIWDLHHPVHTWLEDDLKELR